MYKMFTVTCESSTCVTSANDGRNCINARGKDGLCSSNFIYFYFVPFREKKCQDFCPRIQEKEVDLPLTNTRVVSQRYGLSGENVVLVASLQFYFSV